MAFGSFDQFSRYFPPRTDAERQALWKSAVFSFDANILLDIYRSTPEAAEQILAAFIAVGDQLKLTHQAVLEFARNRDSEIAGVKRPFQEVVKRLTELQAPIIELKRVVDEDQKIIPWETIGDKISGEVAEAIDRIKKLQERHSSELRADPFIGKLSDLMKGKICEPFNVKDHQTLLDEGTKRFAADIPPGTKDKAKTGEAKFGDLFVFKQLIRISQELNKPLIFITNDKKTDWWKDASGERSRLRDELIDEFFKESGQTIYAYTLARFLEHAETIFNVRINKETISQAKELAEHRQPASIEQARSASVFDGVEMALYRGVVRNVVSAAADPHIQSTVTILNNSSHSGFLRAVVQDDGTRTRLQNVSFGNVPAGGVYAFDSDDLESLLPKAERRATYRLVIRAGFRGTIRHTIKNRKTGDFLFDASAELDRIVG